MKLKLNGNKIVGFGAFGNSSYPEYSGDIPDHIVDNHDNPLYEFMDGKIISLGDSRTGEQIEKDRTDAIESEIPYTLQQEIALTNKGIADKEDPEYLVYREAVDAIKVKYSKS